MTTLFDVVVVLWKEYAGPFVDTKNVRPIYYGVVAGGGKIVNQLNWPVDRVSL